MFALVVFGIVWDLRHDCRLFVLFFVCSVTHDGNDFIEIESPVEMIGFSRNEVKQPALLVWNIKAFQRDFIPDCLELCCFTDVISTKSASDISLKFPAGFSK